MFKVATLLCALSVGAAAEDTFTSGYVYPTQNSSQAGLFYLLYNSRFEPESDPLVLWLQGGPGASSLLGCFFENGPYNIQNSSSGEPELVVNPFSWNSNANLLYMDQPFGTGFSYTNDASLFVTDMDQMATHLLEGLTQVLAKHPFLAGKPLFISGESYAGKYLPYLATHILSQPQVASSLNFQGILLGNGWTDPPTIVSTYSNFAYEHGLIDPNQKQTMDQMYADFAAALKTNFSLATEIEHGMEAYVETVAGVNAYDVRALGKYDFSLLEQYLNSPAVQKSLGVNRKFQVLNSTVNTILKPDIAKSALPLIGPLLEHTAGASPSLQVVFYTGIFDFDCNIVGHLAWLSQVEWSGKAALAAVNRTVFQHEGVLAGYARSIGNFTQLSIQNSGHMVPMNQPAVALDMLNRVLAGAGFQTTGSNSAGS